MFLKRALDSLSAQSFKDYEVIIIDDGSTDRTSEIASHFTSSDKRFRLLGQENSGVAASRQRGLDEAKGEYTIHLDADDWMEPNMLEVLYNKARKEDADMVICDYFEHTSAGISQVSQNLNGLDRIAIWGEMMWKKPCYLWNKLIRKRCYTEHGIRFIKGMNACEDLYAILRILAHNIRVCFIDIPLYHYDRTQNENSLVTMIDATKRMIPMDRVAAEEDLTPVIHDFNNAVFMIAHHYLFTDKNDYINAFGKYKSTILHSQDFPLKSRLLILSKLWGFQWIVDRFH